MWTDDHGSEVLVLEECHRLLELAAAEGVHGHLGFRDSGAPTVLPLDFGLDGPHLVVRIGDGLHRRVAGVQMVAFQVDGQEDGRVWSVLVRGYAEDAPHPPAGREPRPQTPSSGTRLVRITADVVTGRRFVPRPAADRSRPGERQRRARPAGSPTATGRSTAVVGSATETDGAPVAGRRAVAGPAVRR